MLVKDSDECVINGDGTLSLQHKPAGYPLTVSLAIIAGLVVAIYLTASGHYYKLLIPEGMHWLTGLVQSGQIWVVMGVTLLVVRTLLWFSYKPYAADTCDTAPELTVIIPAYNEGAMVEKTIESVLAAEYPHQRLQVFVIDDGSQDDTWKYIQRVSQRYPELITAIKFPQNKGKRHALDTAFRQARGEVLITIDSDSIIEQQTLLEMTGPFRDSKVGAVAGRVSVFNRRQHILPRMLHVRFVLAFDFLRAVQSTYKTVYCTPGALSAYRASVVREVNDAWLGQSFLGRPCTFGEDRAMTNYILDQGYDSVYQRNAVVHTIVPVTYMRLCKMLLRWDRSYIREELRFMRIMWKRPLISCVLSVIDSVISNLRFPMIYFTMGLMVYFVVQDPAILLRFLITIGVMSSLSMLYFLKTERSWEIVYGVIYSYFAYFALSWIFPYAILTVRARSWMTR
ncbi:MAG: glycosyltransferase [Thioalkalispiraceae bacterium]|jgi:hyaluronan synthase